jgi:hypothetical protein
VPARKRPFWMKSLRSLICMSAVLLNERWDCLRP